MKPRDVPTDIYRMLITKCVGEDVDIEAVADAFAEECKVALLNAIGPEQVREGRLRLSGVGKPDRQVYHEYHGAEAEQLAGSTYVKFLYGHIIEAMLLALTELAGHEVTEKQKVCTAAGVVGHQDCRIDGVLADVKSASTFGFEKFKKRKLPFDDPFGYVPQILAYAEEEQDRQFGWLAMDKQHGHICWLGYDMDNLTKEEEKAFDFDVKERIQQLKKTVEGPLPPICHDPIPDGTSGNKKLATGCAYCAYKHQCFPDVRTFIYSNGPRYLTHVEKEPKVVEVLEGF